MSTSAVGADRHGSSTLEHAARRHPVVVAVARIGWVAKGLVYALLGVLAFPIAFDGTGSDDGGTGGGQASQTGAVARLAESSVGEVALWIVAVGLMLYVVWRAVSIALPAANTAKAWLTRGGYAVSVIIYTALAWSAISFACGGDAATSGAESEDAKVERATRAAMEHMGGRWLVGIVGVALVGVGVYFVARGIRASFRDELDGGSVGPFSHEAIVTLGRVGWMGRGMVMIVVGWFVTRSAIRFRPDEAKGFDGSLREATSTTAGSMIVVFVAVTLIVYGTFCVISAPKERLGSAD